MTGMATGPAPRRGEHELTLTERARRAQLIDVTIDLVADHGYAGASLARIAEGADLTKAAVLYHFPSKDALVRAAYEHVLTALAREVGAAVEAAATREAPQTYVRSMIGHLREHPRHTRMLVEALSNGEGDHAPEARWGPLAALITAAQVGNGRRGVDARDLSIIIGGAVDAIVSERLNDPDYDTAAAAEQLVQMIEAALATSVPQA